MDFIYTNTQICHNHYDLPKNTKRFDCSPGVASCEDRRMQRAAMSCFAPSTVQECTIVLDCIGAEARREIARDAPPPLDFFTTNVIITKKRKRIRKMKTLEFGSAVEDITPKIGLPLCGYFNLRPNRGYYDRLKLKAAVFRTGDSPLQ